MPILDDAETLKLSEPIAASLAVSNLIGRYRILRMARDRGMMHFNEGDTRWTLDDLKRLFTPKHALEYFRSIMPIEFSEPLFENLITARAFTLAATTSETIKTKVARVIEDRIETGKLVRAAPREIDEILEDAGISHRKGYGELVFRTNIMESYRHGGWDQYESPSVVEYFPVWEYTGIADGRERGADRQKAAEHPELPDHHRHFRKYWPREVSFFQVRGTAASDVINCVLPGNKLSGIVSAASKANYSGPAIELLTSRGTRISVTINHPVFTEHGLVSAGKIEKGQNLITHLWEREGSSCVDVQNGPALIEQIFKSLGSIVQQKTVLPFDFDGDGHFMDGNIDVVRPALKLPFNRDARFFENVGDFCLPTADDRSVRGSDLFNALTGTHLRPLDSFGVALVSRNDSRRNKSFANRSAIYGEMFRHGVLRHSIVDIQFGQFASVDLSSSHDLRFGPVAEFDAAMGDPVRNRLAFDANFLRNLIRRFSGTITTDYVVDVRRFHYSGPVYDVETPNGYFSVSLAEREGVLTRNCRCDFIPVDRREWARLQREGARLETGL